MRAVVFWSGQDVNRVTKTDPYIRELGASSANVRIPADEWETLGPQVLPLLLRAGVTSYSRILFVLADQPLVTEATVRQLLEMKESTDLLDQLHRGGTKKARAVERLSGMVRLRDGMEPRARKWAKVMNCSLSEAVHRMLDEKMSEMEQRHGVGASPGPTPPAS